MGSGHFLVNLVDYLADRVITAMAEAEAAVDGYVSPLIARIDNIRTTIMAKAEARGWTIDEDQLDDRHIVRRMVLKRCVYGVDKNPMAVELAKVALWLHTFTVGAPLSFLDHHLRYGDSLFGSWVRTGIETATKQGGSLFLAEPITRATRAAAPMQILEGLTDAEIAEAHRSAEVFAEIEAMTTPLNTFLSLVQAFEWLNIRDRDDKAALFNYFSGTFGDPIEIAAGTIEVVQESQGWRTLRRPARSGPPACRGGTVSELASGVSRRVVSVGTCRAAWRVRRRDRESALGSDEAAAGRVVRRTAPRDRHGHARGRPQAHDRRS